MKQGVAKSLTRSVDAALAAGKPSLAEAIRHYQPGNAVVADLETRILKIDGNGSASITNDPFRDGELPVAKGELKEVMEEIVNLPLKFDPQRDPLKARISALSTQRTEALNQLRAEMPSFLEQFAEQALQAQWQPLDEELQRIKAQINAYSAAELQERNQLQAQRAKLEKRVDALRRESARLNEAARLLKNLSDPSQSGPFHDHKLYFNQAVWLRLSPGEVMSLARRRYMFKGEMLCERMDPAPVAITGNYVAYRWRFDDAQKTQDFKTQHVEPFTNSPDQDLKAVISTIAVPTGGVFGEAVLGQGVSAEKIDLSRFWNWKDSMIPILPTSINPLAAAKPTIQMLSAEPGKLDESSAKLGQLQDLPAPSGFGALAQTMQAQVLRDMSGQAMLQSLAEATTKAAASSEQNAASIASQNLKAGLDFVKDMSSKAMSAMASSETGGTGGALGDMLKNKEGSTSLLGGVLNANDGKGNGELLSALTGTKAGKLGTLGDAAGEAASPTEKSADDKTSDSQLEPNPQSKT